MLNLCTYLIQMIQYDLYIAVTAKSGFHTDRSIHAILFH